MLVYGGGGLLSAAPVCDLAVLAGLAAAVGVRATIKNEERRV